MEKWSNNIALQKKGLKSNGLIFFYQRWSELLNSNTLDTYQYKALTTYGALLELIEIIEGIKNGTMHLANLSASLNETDQLIKDDFILAKNASHIKNRLLHHLNRKNYKTDEEIAMLRLKYQIQYSLGYIKEKYLIWILNSLKDAIERDDFEQINSLSTFLSSECIRRGWSPKALYNFKVLFEGENSFSEKWDNFYCAITSEKKNFIIMFKFESSKKIDLQDVLNLQELGLEVILGAQIEKNYYNQADNLSNIIGRDSYYFSSTIDAFDWNSAIFESLEKINQKLNLVAFYKILEPWPAKPPKVIVIDPTAKQAQSIDLSNLLEINDYVDSSLKIFQVAKKVILYKKLHPETIKKFQGAFLYNNLSKLSIFQEVKFINLWVAMESFVRTGQHENIIDHIKKIIPPSLCVRYIYRLLRNFADDCKRCGVQIEKADGLPIDFEQDYKTKIVEELISVFKDENLYLNLLNKCEVNYLLHYRCNKIKSQILDGPSIAKTLKNHYKKIEWHLQRLYRVRNAITHSALFSNKPIIIYIRNLSEYLSIVVTESIFQLDKEYFSCIEEVFEAIVDNYNIVIDIFDSNCNYDSNLLLDGVFDLI